VTRQTCLARQHNVVFNDGASCESDLSHDEAALPDPDIVCDLNEVVDLGPRSNHCVAQAPSVNGRVRTYLNVVSQIAAAYVRDVNVATW
jgi:hypothetical protein